MDLCLLKMGDRRFTMTLAEGLRRWATMRAGVGDRIVFSGRWSGQRDRACRVLEVLDASGDPRYVVRWDDTGKVDLFSAGPGGAVVNYHHERC